MNDIEIKLFLEAAQTNNFSIAATNLNYTQPAFSRHINTLEKELGIKLFHRTNKGVSLTEAGEIMFNLFNEFSKQFLDAKAEVEKLNVKSEVVIAITEGFPYDALISEIYENFCKSHPDINVKIITDNYFAINDYLQHRLVDLAVSHNSALESVPNVELTPLQEIQLEIAYARNMFPANDGKIQLKELCDKKHIVYEDSNFYPGYIDYLHQILIDAGLQCEEIRVHNSQTMKSLLFSGRGFTLISEHSIEVKDNPVIETIPILASVVLCIANDANNIKPEARLLKKFIENYYSK